MNTTTVNNNFEALFTSDQLDTSLDQLQVEDGLLIKVKEAMVRHAPKLPWDDSTRYLAQLIGKTASNLVAQGTLEHEAITQAIETWM